MWGELIRSIPPGCTYLYLNYSLRKTASGSSPRRIRRKYSLFVIRHVASMMVRILPEIRYLHLLITALFLVLLKAVLSLE